MAGNEFPSADGRFVLRLESSEMRMSHWLEQPVLVEQKGGKVLLTLAHSLWNASGVEWTGPSRVTMELIRYPGDAPAVTVSLEAGLEEAEVSTHFHLERMPLPVLLPWLEHYYAWYKREWE